MKLWLTYFFISAVAYCAGQSGFPYEFSVEHRPYVPLNNPIDLTPVPGWDSARYTIHFPFEFNYMGTEVDSIYSFLHSADLMMAEGHMFLPFHTFIRDRSLTDSTEVSKILYQVLEEDSGQVLVVEYRNIGFWDNVINPLPGDAFYLNFQLHFYEFSNKIEICFGKKMFWAYVTLHVGQPIVFSNSVTSVDPLMFDSTWYLTGMYDNPTIASGDSATLIVNIGPEPEPTFISGMNSDSLDQNLDSLVYTFTPIQEPVSVEEFYWKPTFKVYPNPSHTSLTVESSTSELFSVYNTGGVRVLSKEITGLNTHIDISELLPGLYIIHCGGNRGTFIKY